MRVAVLAKASSLTGAMLTGAGLGLLIYMLSRAVLPQGGTIGLTAGATAGAIILLIGGLVAERLCTLPPPRDDDPEAHPTAG